MFCRVNIFWQIVADPLTLASRYGRKTTKKKLLNRFAAQRRFRSREVARIRIPGRFLWAIGLAPTSPVVEAQNRTESHKNTVNRSSTLRSPNSKSIALTRSNDFGSFLNLFVDASLLRGEFSTNKEKPNGQKTE